MNADVIMQYSGLVGSIAKKFYGADYEDLLQAGFMGLLKAYKNFDQSSSTKFSSYAYHYIYGEMYEVIKGSRPIHIEKQALKVYHSVIKARELLTQKYKRDVTISEVCNYLNIDYNLVCDIFNSLNDSISIENTELNLSRKDHLDDMILLKESLDGLSDVERQVIESRYMQGLTQEETADNLGISQVSVSRLEKKSKNKILEYVHN